MIGGPAGEFGGASFDQYYHLVIAKDQGVPAMRSSLVFLAGLVLQVLAGPAAAQNNLIGLFADDQATTNQIQDARGQLSLYLVALNPTYGGRAISNIQGFEASISFQETSDFVMGTSFPVDHVNIGTQDNWIVGYGEPLLVQGPATVIASVVVYTAGNPESNIFLGPAQPPSIPGYMALLDAESLDDDNGGLVPMEPASRDFSKPVFLVNSAGLTEFANWGTAKSLFR